MINKMKIKKTIVGLLVGCMTVQAMIPNNVSAKPQKEVPVTSFISLENDECIGMKGNELALSKTNGKKQQWRVEPVDQVFCTIKNEQNNKLMEIEQDEDGEWTVALERKETLEDEQLWYVEICEEDTYRIKSKANDLCLEIEKEDDGSYSFSLGEVAEEDTQLWEMNEKSYDYANQYFTYLEEQNPELVSMKEQIKIEELQDKRIQLCYNYEENQEEIEKLDNELESLGVVELTANEVAAKMGEENEATSPNARVAVYPATDGEVWTSSRVCVAYRGKIIELQILVANPKYEATSATSELISRTERSTHAVNVKAATQELLKAIGQNIVEGVVEGVAAKHPVIGGAIATGVTVMEWAEIFISELSTSTVIDNLDTSYIINQRGETKKVYAKYQGLSDNYQILAYMGNKSSITVEVIAPAIYVGNEYLKSQMTSYEGWVASPDYESNYRTHAAHLYYNYKNGLPEMEASQLIYAFYLEFADGESYRMSMPVYYY